VNLEKLQVESLDEEKTDKHRNFINKSLDPSPQPEKNVGNIRPS
jgi:hypothetical protein